MGRAEKEQAVTQRLQTLLAALERLQLAEYIRYLDDWKRMMKMQFLGGVARGAGVAVGFTVLGAAVVILLNRLTQHNLPVIGDFLAQITAIVRRSLELE